MKILCLDYEKIKEAFPTFSESENIFTFSVPITIAGETGKSFTLSAKIKGLIPPDEFPNMMMVIDKDITGRGRGKYYREASNTLDYKLRNYKVILPPISFEEPSYIGVLEERFDKKFQYEPFIFYPNGWKEEPIISESIKWGDSSVRYNYFKLKDGYYYAKGDPIRDAVNGEVLKQKEQLIKKLSENVPMIGRKEDLKKEFPQFLYKGYASVLYFNDELFFNDNYSTERDHIVKQVNSSRGYIGNPRYQGYKTINEFFYAFEEKFPDIRKRAKVNNPDFIGEEYEEFPEGMTVTIYSPSERHINLQDVKGIVTGKYKEKVKVKFLDYFTENFNPNELKNTEEVS